MMIRMLGHCLSPAGRRGALTVLIFHRVLGEPDALFPGVPDRAHFDRILRWVGAGFDVLPLDEAAERLAQGRLPARAAAITFDDGYADNREQALPILQRHGMCATFFVATDFLDGGRMWNDTVIEAVRRFTGEVLDLSELGLGAMPLPSLAARRQAINRLLMALKYLPPGERQHKVERIAAVAAAAGVVLPDDLMMRSAQVAELHAAGMQVGGHTCSHPILASLDDAAARAEIATNKRRLEAIVGAPLRLFAYPNGKPDKDYLARHVAMVREAGYQAAVSTAPGAARQGGDLLQLPRFTPWDRTPLRFRLRLLHNLRGRGEVVADEAANDGAPPTTGAAP